ncbi:rRNA maturation RNase YbeY [Candidatus Dojkabacteria bacterium]|nr:rRNA maturation RNase YbeY [Candidatus Dojkabacteria bacterium]
MSQISLEFHNFSRAEDWFAGIDPSELTKALEKALTECPATDEMKESPQSGVINVVFVSPEEIRDLNLKFRNKRKPTDVLSFSYPNNSDNTIGEVYLSPEYLKIADKKEAKAVETVRLIIHGVLHILGYDHKGYFTRNESGKLDSSEKMFVLQEQCVSKVKNEFGIENTVKI